MKSSIYIDATFGISGDMIIGAFIDLGVPLDYLSNIMNLVLPKKVELSAEKVLRNGIVATKFYVDVLGEENLDKSWLQIREKINKSLIQESIKLDSIKVFSLLADVEAQIHGIDVDDVCFHEVGAIDSICDIVCACACFSYLKVTNLYCGVIEVGHGIVKTEHGLMPVPAPATLELLRNWSFSSNFGGECATPTGVAIIKSLASQLDFIQSSTLVSTGYGAGSRDSKDHPNILRVLQLDFKQDSSSSEIVLESNIDDMDPRIWPILLSELFEAGAKDAWVTPIIMKKGRPAGTLSVLCKVEDQSKIEELIFSTTSTIGLRITTVIKRELSRVFREIEIFGKPIRLKISIFNNMIINVSQEFEDVMHVGKELNVPIKSVMDQAKAVAISSGYIVGTKII